MQPGGSLARPASCNIGSTPICYCARCCNMSAKTATITIASGTMIAECTAHHATLPGYSLRSSAGRLGASSISSGNLRVSRSLSSCPSSHVSRFNPTTARPVALISNQSRDRLPDPLLQATSTLTTRRRPFPLGRTRSRRSPEKISRPFVITSFVRLRDNLITPITPTAISTPATATTIRAEPSNRSE